PKSIRPLTNVNIMLCSIDAMRELPLTKTPSGKTFEKALKGWSAISDNIFVWDYGINFDNYLSPFPNFHVLQDNMQLFHDHNTTMHFSQIGGPLGCNFAELRAYMVSKLMWNVNADTDELMKEFLDGYYGAASKYMYEYIKIMEGALLASEKRLWIYDSPVTHKNGMLNPHLLEKYEKLFDDAEAAVQSDSVLLSRIQIARLPILYSYLEIKRTENTINPAEVNKRLTYFEDFIRKYKILTLNERNNAPLEYCEIYKNRYLNRDPNLASGKKVTYLTEPTGKYAEIGQTALTDGMYGGTTFADSWVGWEGSDGSFVLDLGEKTSFETVTVDFLHQLGSWILLPKSVTFSYSSDGTTFERLDRVNLDEDKDSKVKFVSVTNNNPSKYQGRYIKVEVEGTKICPPWHYGVGRNCWFFIDEVVVE
ncbi:MAG TPA: DUF4838 domain-containing protein, partial [Saprospiraceae bacterium]|nr:DUF4838 domain-containing protein [Saprospiraceae bacterium]